MASIIGGAASAEGVRQRKKASKRDERNEQTASEELATSDDDVPRDKPDDVKKIDPGTYWLTRITFVRALGFLYCNHPAL